MRNLTSNISPWSGLHLHHRSTGEPEVRWDVEEHETCKILCEVGQVGTWFTDQSTGPCSDDSYRDPRIAHCMYGVQNESIVWRTRKYTYISWSMWLKEYSQKCHTSLKSRWAKYTLTSTIAYSLSSQLTPQPHPVPFACGLSTIRKLLPINSVA